MSDLVEIFVTEITEEVTLNVTPNLIEVNVIKGVAPTNPITGTGTTNFIPKFTGASTLGNSLIFDNGTNVGIGIEAQSDAKLYVQGALNIPAARFLRQASYGTVIEIGRQGFSFGASFGYPDDNTLSINTNSSERLRITSSGNVGIGTTSPTSRLEVRGATAQFQISQDTTHQMYFGVDSSYAEIQAIRSGVGFDKPLILQRQGGNVGIGTTSPQGIFEAVGLSYLTRSGQSLLINPNYGGANTHIQFQAVQNVGIAFATNGDNERMRITSGGNVGIGTTSPARPLDVNGSIAWGATAGAFMYAGGTSHLFAYSASNINLLFSGGSGGFGVNNAADSVRLLQILDSGNVGIGTTSPAQRLDVNGLINSTNGISVGGEGVSRFWTGTQAAYDAITTKVSTTVYLIT